MIGQTISHYRITDKLGAGGMGVVYRAEDTNLERQVAIKVLPDIFSGDPERLARFEREAKLLASLNHPNIATIHGLGQADGTRFLVMELVEGETLAQRIAKGPLPVDEALEVCRQITEGLEAAHEKGIIHRDLKPANVKVTPEGKVKVLDFGLAKAFEGETAAVDASHSPTLTDQMTRPGVILGTAAYMSPEQTKGRVVDKRTDIWAFGCVLYECLAGKRAFEGETVTETLASILKGEPDWSALPVDTPQLIRRLLSRCLEKNLKERLRDIGDAQIGIFESLLMAPAQTIAKAGLLSGSVIRLGLPLALLCLATGSAATWLLFRYQKPESAPLQVVRFPLTLPPDQQFSNTGRHAIAVSPDGSQLAYSANSRLFLRSMNGMEFLPVRGTEAIPGNTGTAPAINPFFSPDGKQLGFWADGKLRKVSVNGGPVSPLCESLNPWGVSWADNDAILFGQGKNGIWQVSSNGGKARQLIKPDTTKNEVMHGPQLLPGGEWVLFTLATTNGWDDAQIAVQSLKTGERKILIDAGRDARYISTGHLVYVREGMLLAVPLDLRGFHPATDPVQVVEGIATSTQDLTGAAHFSFSANGTLVYVTGGVSGLSNRKLVWVDREGKDKPAINEQLPYRQLRLSPNGRRLAVVIENRKRDRDIWVYDLYSNNPPIPLTRGGCNQKPLWTPEGDRMVFTFAKACGSQSNLDWIPADGNGKPEVLLDRIGVQAPWSMTHDGKQLLFTDSTAGARDIWVLQLGGVRQARRLLESKFRQQEPAVTPDDRWIAYTSDRSGANEIWIASYPDQKSIKRVTSNRGWRPWWSRDGKKLYYVAPGQKMMEVAFDEVRGNFVGQPKIVFAGNDWFNEIPNYDVTQDGRLLTILNGDLPAGTAPAKPDDAKINIVLNWFEELKRLAPTGRK